MTTRGIGICDRCSFQYKLKDLHSQVINQRKSGLLVCKDCLDIDHEQLRLGNKRVVDKEAQKNPRPDPGLADSRELTGSYDPATHAVL